MRFSAIGSGPFRSAGLRLRVTGSLRIALAAGALWGITGCHSSTTPGPSVSRYEVIVPNVAFYHQGPAQGTGPDARLTVGTKVTLLQNSHGYSHIKLAEGQAGYVLSSTLKQLPPERPPARGAFVKSSIKPSGNGANLPVGGSDDLLFPSLDLPLPEPPQPTAATPKPGFRF